MKIRFTLIAAMLAALLFGGLAITTTAQTTHECDTTRTGPFTTYSGRPFTVRICLPTFAVEQNAEFPMRWDGLTVQVDTGTAVDIPAGSIQVIGTPSPVSRKQLYSIVMTSGVAKGTHSVTARFWNWPLDASDNPIKTGERQVGAPIVIPFVANDPVMRGAPPAPAPGWIIR